jgi:hypothetical protein
MSTKKILPAVLLVSVISYVVALWVISDVGPITAEVAPHPRIWIQVFAVKGRLRVVLFREIVSREQLRGHYILHNWADMTAAVKRADQKVNALMDSVRTNWRKVKAIVPGVWGFSAEAQDTPVINGVAAGRLYILVVPFWAIIVLLSVCYSALMTIKWLRRRRRVRENCCTKCGYDLRGLPEPRCPECGTPFHPQECRLKPGNQL